MSSKRNGIFDEIAYRKPRRKVEIKYSTDGIIFFVLAGIFGFLILIAVISYSAGVCGCNCSSYRTKPKLIAVEEDLASNRFFATDNIDRPSEQLQQQINEMKQALTTVNNSVQDLNTRLARDEQMLDNTQANVGRFEENLGKPVETDNYVQDTLTQHVGQINSTKRVLRDLENTLNANDDHASEDILMTNYDQLNQ